MSEITWNLSLKQTPIVEMASTSLPFRMHINDQSRRLCQIRFQKIVELLHQTRQQSYDCHRWIGWKIISSGYQLPIDMHIIIPNFRSKVEMQTLEEAMKVKEPLSR